VFSIPEASSGHPRATLAQNKPAKLFLVPALAGRYTVEVRPRNRSRWLKQGQLGHALTVLEPGRREPRRATTAVTAG
jgi:hypothetical protein